MSNHKLLIVDDIFPCKLSPFRYEEFDKILSSFGDAHLVTTGAALRHLHSTGTIEELVEEYKRESPDNANRITIGNIEDALADRDYDLVYCVFLNNIYSIIERLEEKRIPFAFTLYPGGGFALDDEESEEKLERVLRSPCFRKVIVNEQITRDYLREKGWCRYNEIILIPGVVVPQSDIENAKVSERPNRDRFVISFCAYKYSSQGRDKGYDFFVEVAKKLEEKRIPSEFHIVGNFDENDVPLDDVSDRFHFHGILPPLEMRKVFSETDIILSPVRANVLTPGSFNGFPVTACVAAALSGALVMTTDPLKQNYHFTHGENIDIIELDAQAVSEKIAYYYHRRKQFNVLRKKQIEKMIATYDESIQMAPRLKLLSQEINWSKCNPIMNMTYPRQERLEIPVMHCFDNNYVIPATASFYSMLKYADPSYDYKLFVLHSDITTQNQQMLTNIVNKFPNATLEFIDMSHRFDDVWKTLRLSGHYSKEVLYKLLVASIFPQYDKILITDVDVVFSGDIAPSYFAVEPEEPVCFAGVHHVAPKGSFLESYYVGYLENFGPNSLDKLKICGGYLLANLKYMREHDKETQFIDYLCKNTYRLRQSEQDVINFCCTESEVKYLPLANVVCTYMYDIFENTALLDKDDFYTAEEMLEAMEHPIQVHYATGTKPWKDLMSTKADLWLQNIVEADAYYEYMTKAKAVTSPEVIGLDQLGPGWKPNNSPIVVSVLCCTYNHEKYIRQALDGIVKQKANFKFEVVVADDASTDNTQQIIREYAEKYPDIMRCILREKNIGIGPNYYDALQQVNGKYLAICDGDDYWSDPEKLQKQVDFMEAHRDCTVCCASFVRHEHRDEGITEVPFAVEDYIRTQIPEKESYTFEDLLYCRFVASCTVMLRWQYMHRVPEFLKYYPVIDFPLALLHAAGGRIYVMHGYSPSVYNVHIKSVTNSNSSEKLQAVYTYLLNEINQYLNYKFNATITEYFNGMKTGNLKLRPSVNIQSVVELITTAGHENPSLPVRKRMYRVLVVKPIKLAYRASVCLLKFMYRELVPNIFKRMYRFAKRAAKYVVRRIIVEVRSR